LKLTAPAATLNAAVAYASNGWNNEFYQMLIYDGQSSTQCAWQFNGMLATQLNHLVIRTCEQFEKGKNCASVVHCL
jgi:hypothetical protein